MVDLELQIVGIHGEIFALLNLVKFYPLSLVFVPNVVIVQRRAVEVGHLLDETYSYIEIVTTGVQTTTGSHVSSTTGVASTTGVGSSSTTGVQTGSSTTGVQTGSSTTGVQTGSSTTSSPSSTTGTLTYDSCGVLGGPGPICQSTTACQECTDCSWRGFASFVYCNLFVGYDRSQLEQMIYQWETQNVIDMLTQLGDVLISQDKLVRTTTITLSPYVDDYEFFLNCTSTTNSNIKSIWHL
jgi:hypothetical protein